MLTEFAITTDVLRQWEKGRVEEDHLRELASGLFPRGTVSPAIVSNLYDGAWLEEAVKAIAGINKQSARVKAQNFLRKLQIICVARPKIGERPTNEEGWVMQAVNQEEPIQRIVTSRELCDRFRPPSRCLFSPDAAAGEAFWKGFSPVRPVLNRLDEQVDVLRPICVHSAFIAFASPQIYGGSDDETDFAAKLICSALNRPRGFRHPQVHIHTEGPADAQGRATRAANIVQQLRGASGARACVTLFVWKKLLERTLLAGDFVLQPGREEAERGVRWGVSITHVARTTDRLDDWRSTFALMDKDTRMFWEKKLYPIQGGVLPEIFEV